MVDDYAPARLADRARIQDLMYRWCRALDRLDYDAMRRVFHPDAIDRHGMYEGGVDGLVAWLRERHRTIPFCMHAVTNMLIEFAGPDTALVETYCIALQRHTGVQSLAAIAGARTTAATGGAEVTAYVRYVDRFERRSDEWRIAHRTVVWDAVTTRDAPPGAAAFDERWTAGRRGQDDPIYAARAEVNL